MLMVSGVPDALRVNEQITRIENAYGYPSRRFMEVWDNLRRELELMQLSTLAASMTPAGQDVTITREPTGYLLTYSGGGTAVLTYNNGVLVSINDGAVTNINYDL